MAKRVGAALGLLGGTVAITAAAGPTALGCATGVDPTGFGADGAGVVEPTPIAPAIASDDAASPNGAVMSVMSADSAGGNDSTATGVSSDSGSSDTAARNSATEVGAPFDAGAGSDTDAGHAADADAGPKADADATAPCDTAAILFGDAGASGHTLLFAFDNGAGASNWIGVWDQDPTDAAAPIGITGLTRSGHSCPGALRASFPFSAFGQQGEVQYNYNPPLSLTAEHNIHMWVRLVVFGGGYSNFSDLVAPVTQWTTDASSTSDGSPPDQSPQTFADGAWHECIAPLGPTDAGQVSLNLRQLAAYLLAQSTDAGPPPSTAVLYLDDIWIE